MRIVWALLYGEELKNIEILRERLNYYEELCGSNVIYSLRSTFEYVMYKNVYSDDCIKKEIAHIDNLINEYIESPLY